MATKTKPKPRKRLKQNHLPGMEPPSVAAIDRAAEDYVKVRDERMEMTKDEVEKHDRLLGLMREHGLDTYEFDGFTINCQTKTKVKVKRTDEYDSEDEGDDDD